MSSNAASLLLLGDTVVVLVDRDSYTFKSELNTWNFLVIIRNMSSIDVMVPPRNDSKSPTLVVYLSFILIVAGELENHKEAIAPS